MMRRAIALGVFTWLVISLTGVGNLVFASGTVYYGPAGSNYRGCYYCRTYQYTYNEACRKSDATQDIYYIYHANNGYAGFCDKSGGGGTEPRDREAGTPPVFGSVLWSTLAMAIAGFVLGMTYPKSSRQPD